MSLEISVGPPQLAISEGNVVLLTELDGGIAFPSEKGLYFYDTRLISSWSISVNGQSWELLNSANIGHYASRIFLTNPELTTEAGPIPRHSLGLSVGRSLGEGMHEDLDIANYGPGPAQFNLEFAIRCDFADLFEVKANKIVRRGRISTSWSSAKAQLTTKYRNRDFLRSVSVLVRRSGCQPVYANGRLSFQLQLPAGATWHACLLYRLGNDKEYFEPPSECIEQSHASPAGKRVRAWRDKILKISTSSEIVSQLYSQAVQDMAGLRLPLGGTDHLRYVPAGGVPWFVALFGRDSLIASLQSILVYSDFATATLEVLADYQASERDDRRDAEPGKIMHELRQGELAHFGMIPHTPYYGTADATTLYLILLHAAWQANGDKELLAKHYATAERCLTWIEQYGDRDGDGFQEYATRSPVGYENQGWKDAGDALVDVDGSPVKGPKALCELQGYVYEAWTRMAEVCVELGKLDRAKELRAKAAALMERFDRAFWDEEAGFYAFALDGDKKKVMSVASNPGQCLWSGIVPVERARKVVARLMQPDMRSGWGIRTLSSQHAAFNPYSYQKGSVWPHDNGLIALGFRRYGFDQEACLIMQELLGAGGFFDHHQMPELYAGVQRSPTNFPVHYLGTNVPQAWAAGTIFMVLRIILGFQPDAPHDMIYLDPFLPAWLPDLTVRDLSVGKRNYDIRFWRDGDTSSWEVLRGDPARISRRAFAVGPILWGEQERAHSKLPRA